MMRQPKTHVPRKCGYLCSGCLRPKRYKINYYCDNCGAAHYRGEIYICCRVDAERSLNVERPA